MKEIRTDADGYPVWQERLAWKVEGFWWEFVESLELMFFEGIGLLKNPFMILLVVAFAISAVGTAWWGW